MDDNDQEVQFKLLHITADNLLKLRILQEKKHKIMWSFVRFIPRSHTCNNVVCEQAPCQQNLQT